MRMGLAVSDNQLASLLGEGDTFDGYKKLRSQMHRDILSLLALRERMIIDDIKSELSATDSQISALEKKGYIVRETQRLILYLKGMILAHRN